MRDLLFVSDKLDDINRELGVSSYSGFLEETHRKVKKIVSSDLFYIDVIVHNIAPAKVQQMAGFLKNSAGAGGQYEIQIKNYQLDTVKIFEQIFTGVAIILFDETFNNDTALKERIKAISDQYKVVLLINCTDGDLCTQFSRMFKYNVKTFILPAEDCQEKSIDEVLKLAIPEVDKLDKLKRVSYLNSVMPLFSFLNDIFASENKIVQTRKQLNSQNTQITKKEEISSNISDLASNLRQMMQKLVQELDKNFKLKYDDLNKPNTGTFSVIAKEKSSKLEHFNKSQLAEKSEKVGIAIDKDFQDDFVNSITRSVKAELVKDEAFIKSSMDDLLTKINQQLKTKDITPVKPEEIYIPFPEQQRVINSFCYMSKTYNGELTKQGATEYFIALRDYIGVMMVATGLLAPLNLIATLADEKGPLDWLKHLAKGIKWATALLTIALIVYGIYDLRRRIPLKRVEEYERELLKARELLLNEAKRMYNESSRDWYSNISVWIKETIQNINNQVEKNMKDMQAGKAGKINQEKNQQQKLQQSIELIQRNIQSAEKVKDQLAQRFRELVSETESELKF